ncbi:hypothetical protein CK203_014578 [Vitis vinifera]|uniref:Uncharacterized protein n=1 Tax=Vitis vinifera TaxID=29760 RepID=A0A438K4S2_VITVI|nr:hypothetical protein CK203_014578 [Vitis vinifera]
MVNGQHCQRLNARVRRRSLSVRSVESAKNTLSSSSLSFREVLPSVEVGRGLGKDLQGIRKGDEDLEVTSIKVAYKGHRNSRTKDLTKLPLEELIGSLMTYEINLAKKQQEGEDKKKKSIALKATTKEEEEVEEEKQSEEDEDLALITRKFNKFMRGERFRGKGSLLEETFLKRNLHLMVTRRDGREKRLGVFQVQETGHIKYDCLLQKRSQEEKKKVMMATWSESEESSEEENEKEVANMCFMAIDELDEWMLKNMTKDESKFAFLTKKNGGYVTFGDNVKGRIIGQGNIGNNTSFSLKVFY